MGSRVLFIIKEIEGAEPLGALYVAGALERAGHDCRFVGTRGNDVAAEVRRYRPDVIACGTTTGLHRYYLGLFHHLKQQNPSCLMLMGGPHATHFPEVIRSPGLDVICRGEGEGSAVALCDALTAGRDYRFLPGLWIKEGSTVHVNPMRALDPDLDALPFPPRRLLYAYDDTLRQRSLKSFTVNRGCPFSCSYCFNPAMSTLYGPQWKKVRKRSPKNVLEEIAQVQEEGPLQVVGFRESIFVYSADWLRDFGDRYRRRISVPYYCHLRADLVTEELARLLAWSGCHAVNLGIETANTSLANEVLDRNVDQERMVAGIRRLKAAGIRVFADNMVGIPKGTLADDLATLELNIALDVDYAAATLCTPYPGTKLMEYAREAGCFDGDFDLIDDSYYTTSVLRFPDQEKQRIENLHKLFALTAALPSLLPLVKRLIGLPANDYFYSMFRAWYVFSHMTEIMPRRPTRAQLMESISSIFGIYRGSDREYQLPEPSDATFVTHLEESTCQNA